MDLHLQIARIIFEIKIVPIDCSIRVSRSFAAVFMVSRDLFFLFLIKILGRSGPSNNFSNRYSLILSC